jgi:hypothetical protein
MRFARRPPAQDPVADMRRFAREALGEHTMVTSEPQDGVGAVIIRAGDDRALVWVRAGDESEPALFQSSVWLSDLRDPGSAPVFDPPVSAEQLDAALRFLARGQGRWTPVEPGR